MSKLIQDIAPLGEGIGQFTKLDYGMDESDWRAAEGQSGNYVIGWSGKARPALSISPRRRPTKRSGSSKAGSR